MAYAQHGIHLIDYQSYQLPGSKLYLRGPPCDLGRPYLSFIGGTETFGRYLESPFPHLVGQALRSPVLNLGCVNAGLDVYLKNPELLRAARGATARVIEVLVAQNLSNRYYLVHPNRNDRFVRATQELEALYPEVDFTEIAFNRHLLQVLKSVSRSRFKIIRAELQKTWTDRMRLLMSTLGPSVLFWFADRPPRSNSAATDLSGSILFVTPEMVNAVARNGARLVTLIPDAAVIARGQHGLMYTELERHSAQTQLGNVAHGMASAPLIQSLRTMLCN